MMKDRDTVLFITDRRNDGLNRTPEYRDVMKRVARVHDSLDRRSVESVKDDDICIVADDLPNTNQAEFVSVLENAACARPESISALSGMKFLDVAEGRLSRMQRVATFDRRQFTPRFAANDSGDVTIDVMGQDMACTGATLKRLVGESRSGLPSGILRSFAAAKRGIEIVCIDPGDAWSGLPRIRRSNVHTTRMDTPENMPLFSFRWWGSPERRKARARSGSGHPPVAVIMTTHDRTDTALEVVDSLVANLRYDNLIWYIADDRSSAGHVDRLVERFRKLGVDDVRTTATNDEHFGLGASLNNALSMAFEECDVVLTTEDDWLLNHELDISGHVRFITENDNIGSIRLAALTLEGNVAKDTGIDGYYEVLREEGSVAMTLNLQVALRHRRLYDAVGMYSENVDPETVETDFNGRYMRYLASSFDDLKVLWPRDYECRTVVSEVNPFVHIGESTIGHTFDVYVRQKKNDDTGLASCRNPTACFITDDGYAAHTAVSAGSFSENNPSAGIRVLCWDVSDDKKAVIDGAVSSNGGRASFIDISDDDKARCLEAGRQNLAWKKYQVPPVGLAKFMLPRLLEDLPTALYIDSDTLTTGDASPLFAEGFLDGYFAAAVVDPGCVFLKGRDRWPYIIGDYEYFNSGVMLLNLDELRRHSMEDVLFKTKAHLKKCFMDQDALNAAFKGMTRLIDPKYNTLVGAMTRAMSVDDINRLYGTNYSDRESILSSAVILHYASADKPWNEGGDPLSRLWKMKESELGI